MKLNIRAINGKLLWVVKHIYHLTESLASKCFSYCSRSRHIQETPIGIISILTVVFSSIAKVILPLGSNDILVESD